MSCTNCGSQRVMFVSGKISDMCCCACDYNERERVDYVPINLPICENGNEDYINFRFCLDCGKIQSMFPVSESTVTMALPTE